MIPESLLGKIRNVAGWLTEREADFLYTQAKSCTGRGVILEIGSWQGKSTICLAAGSSEGARQTVHAVDPHINSYVHVDFIGKDTSTFDLFQENIRAAGFSDIVHPIVKLSAEAAKEWRGPIEFLWIDGDHRYAEVKKDFDLWFPFLVEGGVVAFHDSFGDVERFLRKEVFASGRVKGAVLHDSITSMIKVSQITLRDRLQLLWIACRFQLASMLRAMLPMSVKNLIKKFILHKKIIARAK